MTKVCLSLKTVTSYEALVRNCLGPDEFIFNLEGPELHNLNLNMKYRGNCVYDLPFQVTTPGPYHLNLYLFITMHGPGSTLLFNLVWLELESFYSITTFIGDISPPPQIEGKLC